MNFQPHVSEDSSESIASIVQSEPREPIIEHPSTAVVVEDRFEREFRMIQALKKSR